MCTPIKIAIRFIIGSNVFLSENVVANETDHGHRKKLKIIVAIVGNDNIYRT